jgi:hypothetical protein
MKIAAYGVKLCMFATFALWIWRHRGDDKSGSDEDLAHSGGAAPLRRALLLFFGSMFVALAGVFGLSSSEAARYQAAFYPFSLFLTLVLECGFAALWKYRSKRELACVALCSLVTHPTLHLAAFLPEALFGEDLFYDHWVWFLEAMVVTAESNLLNRLLPGRRPGNAKLALAMNAFSFFGGLVIVWGISRLW